MKKNWFLLLAALLGFGSPQVHAKLNVVATLPDIGAIAEAVGGDKIQVTSLARGTEDPHFVDAKPSFLRVLNRADLLIEGGAELEVGWLPPLVNNARNRKILPGNPGRLALASFVRIIETPTGPVDRSQGDVHPAGNPHFLLDPINGKAAANAIAEALGRIDAANAALYTANAGKFNEHLDLKLTEWKHLMEPFHGLKVVTYHKSFNYLLERFGLELAGTIEPKPGIEPSPTHISELISRMKEAGVKLILIEPNRGRKTPEYVATATGAKLAIAPILVGGSPDAKDYPSLFDDVLGKISGALK
jgi:ABC-type Zn uptake system ZnuABC Zn-binding protein ZnuA